MEKNAVSPSQTLQSLRDLKRQLDTEIGELEGDIKNQHDSQIDAQINLSFREKR